MNTSCAAQYFDGQTSRGYAVNLIVAEHQQIIVEGDEIRLSWSLRDVVLSERLGSSTRSIQHPDAGHCLVTDLDAFERFLLALGKKPTLLEKIQHKVIWALGASLVLLIGIVGGYQYGLPLASRAIVMQLPESSLAVLDQHSLQLMDSLFLHASKLSQDRQDAIRQGFAALLKKEHELHDEIVFRSSTGLGANAFALPSGTIVLLDDLVNLSSDDQEIYAVLGHEFGHVKGRHLARLLLQSSVTGLISAWWLGDISSTLASVPATLTGAKFSRDMEREADQYGAALMQKNQLSACSLVTILQKIEKINAEKHPAKSDREPEVVLDYLAGHPPTPERVRNICPRLAQ